MHFINFSYSRKLGKVCCLCLLSSLSELSVIYSERNNNDAPWRHALSCWRHVLVWDKNSKKLRALSTRVRTQCMVKSPGVVWINIASLYWKRRKIRFEYVLAWILHSLKHTHTHTHTHTNTNTHIHTHTNCTYLDNPQWWVKLTLWCLVLVIALRPQTPKNIRGGWSHTDASEPVDGYGAQNMVTVKSEFRTSDLSITGLTRSPTALTGRKLWYKKTQKNIIIEETKLALPVRSVGSNFRSF
jgi:hypothetical protein